DGHLGRCHLKGREGDAANVVLTAVGHNLRLVLAWLSILLRLFLLALRRALALAPALRGASYRTTKPRAHAEIPAAWTPPVVLHPPRAAALSIGAALPPRAQVDAPGCRSSCRT